MRIERERAIEVALRSEVREVTGAKTLEQVTIEDTSGGTRRILEAGALCILIGAEPGTKWLADAVALDDRGYIVTGPASRRISSAPRPGTHSGAIPSCSRRAVPVSLPRAMFAAGP